MRLPWFFLAFLLLLTAPAFSAARWLPQGRLIVRNGFSPSLANLQGPSQLRLSDSEAKPVLVISFSQAQIKLLRCDGTMEAIGQYLTPNLILSPDGVPQGIIWWANAMPADRRRVLDLLFDTFVRHDYSGFPLSCGGAK